MVSLDIVSCTMVSLDIVSCTMVSLDIVSCTMVSLDIVSCTMVSLDIVSCTMVSFYILRHCGLHNGLTSFADIKPSKFCLHGIMYESKYYKSCMGETCNRRIDTIIAMTRFKHSSHTHWSTCIVMSSITWDGCVSTRIASKVISRTPMPPSTPPRHHLPLPSLTPLPGDAPSTTATTKGACGFVTATTGGVGGAGGGVSGGGGGAWSGGEKVSEGEWCGGSDRSGD
nr:hypothetical protein [Tanacetum cinerariifolium]